MSTTTTKLGLRIPQGSDAADLATIIDNLGNDIDALGGIGGLLTTTARNALAGANLWAGRLIYNTTTAQLEYYNGSSWQPVRGADVVTSAGDMLYGSAAGVLARVAAGAQSTIWRMGASSTPGWVALTIPWEVEWAIPTPGVPSGATNFVDPYRANVPSGWTMDARRIAHGVRGGTSVTSDMRKATTISGVTAGSTLTGFTSLSSTTSSITSPSSPTPVSLADGDLIAPVPSAVTGSPDNWIVQVAGLYTFAG